MSRRFWLFGLPLAIAIAGGAIWTLMAREHPPGDPDDAEQVALGAALYGRSCARCHGEDMSGELGWVAKETDLSAEEINRVTKTMDDVAPAHDASGRTSRHDDAALFAIIQKGPEAVLNKTQSRMPAFGGELPDDDIWAIVAFMKSQWQDGGGAAN